MEIKNEFNHKITKSQQKYLDDFLKSPYKDSIIEISLTRGGYLSIDYKRSSRLYPYGRNIRGTRGGFIGYLIGKNYDFENGFIMNGIGECHMSGTYKFTLE